MKASEKLQLPRLLPVLDYIHQHYNRVIVPAELERISFYSYRSLQRIFKALFQENIGAYQKRLRLESAAKLMHYSDKSLTEIALEVGYADLQAFRKAFKKNYGIAPSRQRVVLQNLLQDLEQRVVNLEFDLSTLNPKQVDLPTIEVLYKTHRGAYDNKTIEKLWDDLVESVIDFDTREHYGLVYDDPDITVENLCRYDACITYNINTSNTELSQKTIGGTSYMCFLHQGDYTTIDQTYDGIFGAWLLQNNYNFSSAPIIEYYDPLNTNITAIYIPLA